MPWAEALEQYGHTPLPPYIRRPADDQDLHRYQTVYAKNIGSVAAPTAGLHFDETMLEQLRQAGIVLAWITLHVGAGTFQPVRVDDLRTHTMHRERFSVPQDTIDAIACAQGEGRRVVAVGTTTLRALETAYRHDHDIPRFALEGESDLFILPGFKFQIVDVLLSNFHMPKSTLFMLVCAFSGLERMKKAYAHAIAAGYRFYSYGDACLLDRCDGI